METNDSVSPSGLAALRGAWRVLRVALHLVWALLLAACAFPLLGRTRRLCLIQRWSRDLLALLGVRLQVSGGSPQPGGLLVANHVSWLDIYVINAIAPCTFVAKDDVRAWPLIGWLCQRTETIFIVRGSVRAAQATRAEIAATLASGHTVAVFPEGTTSPGRGVLPFHSALLQGAVDAAVPVRPLALRYIDAADGAVAVADAPVYCGETTLLESLWRIACAPALAVEIAVLPDLRSGNAGRRMLATTTRDMIAVAVEQGWHCSRQLRAAAGSGEATTSPSTAWSPDPCSISSSTS